MCIRDSVGAAGGKAYIRTADIASYEQTDEAVCSLAEAAGGIDIAVNCAAIFEEALFTEMTPQQWRRTVSIDLDGVYNVLHAAMPFIIDAGGSVVNVVSQDAFYGCPGYSHYSACKAAVVLSLRHIYIKDHEPVIQILTEQPLFYHFFQ